MNRNKKRKLPLPLRITEVIIGAVLMVWVYTQSMKFLGNFHIDDDEWSRMVPIDGTVKSAEYLSTDSKFSGMDIIVGYNYGNSEYEGRVVRFTPCFGIKQGKDIRLMVDPEKPEVVWLTKRPADEVRGFMIVVVVGMALLAIAVKVIKELVLKKISAPVLIGKMLTKD